MIHCCTTTLISRMRWKHSVLFYFWGFLTTKFSLSVRMLHWLLDVGVDIKRSATIYWYKATGIGAQSANHIRADDRCLFDSSEAPLFYWYWSLGWQLQQFFPDLSPYFTCLLWCEIATHDRQHNLNLRVGSLCLSYVAVVMTWSIDQKNKKTNKGAIKHPCLTLQFVSIGSDSMPECKTLHFNWLYWILISWVILSCTL
jgi:hypothetical protein